MVVGDTVVDNENVGAQISDVAGDVQIEPVDDGDHDDEGGGDDDAEQGEEGTQLVSAQGFERDPKRLAGADLESGPPALVSAGSDPILGAGKDGHGSLPVCAVLPGLLVARNPAVAHMDDAAGAGSDVALVSHQHDGVAGGLQPVEQVHDFVARGRIEVAGGFVGQQ